MKDLPEKQEVLSIYKSMIKKRVPPMTPFVPKSPPYSTVIPDELFSNIIGATLMKKLSHFCYFFTFFSSIRTKRYRNFESASIDSKYNFYNK